MVSFIDHKLIFSNERKYRVGRHLLFWVCYWLYFGFLHAANSFGGPEIMYFRNLPYTLTESILFLVPQLAITYPMLYFVFPNYYLKRKYGAAIFLTVILWFVGAVISLFMLKEVNQPILEYLMPKRFMRITQRPPNTTFFMGLVLVMKGGMLGVTTTLGIKLTKHLYLKEHRNLQLQRENADAQLQLLTAQVHPHFLFNTLNNIFSQTQTESPRGSKMIMGLSDLLRYILYEGRKPLVPLKQELRMICEYINLEKIRYGNKLDVHVLTPDNVDDVYIAPLLLLPFVENSFKHGASNMLENPWINLTLELKDTLLVMKLMNGKAVLNGDHQNGPGIGINNVQQRLNLLYQDRHSLQIREDEVVFVVDLSVELIRVKNMALADTPTPTESKIVYA